MEFASRVMGFHGLAVSIPDMNNIRIAWVGLGGMGQYHLMNYKSIKGCEVVAAAELRPHLREQVAARFGIPRHYRDHAAMMSSEKVDAIVVIMHYGMHGSLIPELAAYGLPIFTEKALARTSSVAAAIAEASRRHRAPVHVGYHKRSDPATEYAAGVISRWKRSGEMGAMRYVRVTMPPGDWNPHAHAPIIWSDERIPEVPWDPAPAGLDAVTAKSFDVMVAYFIHQINLMRHLLGEDYTLEHVSANGCLLVVRSASGVSGLIEINTYRTSLDWQEEALVTFEKGWVKLELPAPLAIDQPGRVEVYTDPGDGIAPQRTIPVLPKLHGMRNQAQNFLRAVRGEPQPLCLAEDAVKDLEIAERYIELSSPAMMQSAIGKW